MIRAERSTEQGNEEPRRRPTGTKGVVVAIAMGIVPLLPLLASATGCSRPAPPVSHAAAASIAHPR